MGNANPRERQATLSSEGDCESPGRFRRGIPSVSLQNTDYQDGDELEVNSELGPPTIPAVFKWTGGGREVFLSGSFDNWATRIPMSKSQGDFTTIIDLTEGTHEYKFLVDGTWRTAQNEKVVTNDLGTTNNVIMVRHSDFEVFEALAYDGVSLLADSNKVSGVSDDKMKDYSQTVPQVDLNNASQFQRNNLPPTLPPQLVQVLLNNEAPADFSESVLPEPNHVMLNHLYALSIKDGVMAMGSTHRYKKKYVTTLLYKPV